MLQLNDRIARCLQSVLPEKARSKPALPRRRKRSVTVSGRSVPTESASDITEPVRSPRRNAPRSAAEWQAARSCDSFHDVSPHAGPSLKPFRGSRRQLKRLWIGIRQWGCDPPGPGKRAGRRLIHQWKEEFGDSWTSSGLMGKYEIDGSGARLELPALSASSSRRWPAGMAGPVTDGYFRKHILSSRQLSNSPSATNGLPLPLGEVF